MAYAANNAKSKQNTRANHVFNLQQTSRLAHTFAGSTTLQGKKEHNVQMVVRPARANTFEEQQAHIRNILDATQNRVGEQIHKEISVKQNNKRAMMSAIAKGEGDSVGLSKDTHMDLFSKPKDAVQQSAGPETGTIS